MLFKLIVLAAQQKMQKERSISALYYVLIGKQSIQTIQDANLYQIEHIYGIYKNMLKGQFKKIITELEQEQLVIKQNKSNYYQLTTLGKNLVRHNEKLLQSLFVNGKAFKDIDDIYLYRLLLLIQVWTNSKKRHFTFIPIVEHKEVEKWVKAYYQQTKDNVEAHLTNLYEELSSILSLLPRDQAEMFVNQLTGYKTIGMTTEQLMDNFRLSEENVHLTNVSVIHSILHKISTEKSIYPQLYAISEGLFGAKSMTESATITKNLLNNGYLISQIAAIRRLKENTIYDHVVEIALNDEQFPLSEYVEKSVEKEIVQVVKKLQSYKLKHIKMEVSEDITFFQIRLVLARLNREMGGEQAGATIG